MSGLHDQTESRSAPQDDSVRRIDQAIEDTVGTPGIERLVAAYFDPDGNYAGATFHTLQPNEPHRISVADLLAVTTLDVSFPPRALRQLLDRGEFREQTSRLLRKVPNDVALWDCTPDHLTAARQLWKHLYRFAPGVGWVRVNKLLARKRPRMIPVYDRVIRTQFGAPRPLWEPLSQALTDQDLRGRIDALADGIDTHAATTLRVIDVAMWMLHSDAARSTRVRHGVATA